ncbi:hypothetical protein ACFE04_011877 [Oxalis oulophora]
MMLGFGNLFRQQNLVKNPVRLLIIRSWHNEKPIPVSWKKPEYGWTKLNFDGSCRGRGCRGSIGGVIRDHNAEFLLGYAESIGKTTSVLAELASLRRGLELLIENGWKDIWLEGDAKTLGDIIVEGRSVKCKETERSISEINIMLPEFKNFILSHVYREGNRAAAKLAKIGHRLEKPKIWRVNPPHEVLRIVHEDAEAK